jgi:hypothetical protein
MWELIKIALEDVQEAFDINENLYENYVEKEIKLNPDLKRIIIDREKDFDWKKRTPLGGAGTTLNGCVIYALIRYYKPIFSFETGVSGGYYTSFILEAAGKHYGRVTSVELSDDLSKIATLVPERWKGSINWELETGTDSLLYIKEKYPKEAFLGTSFFSHDSLHTMSHMLKELSEFKRSTQDKFVIFIDDQVSDNFWERCIQMNAFAKNGYTVKCISGAESRLKGHMGGFLLYVKN